MKKKDIILNIVGIIYLTITNTIIFDLLEKVEFFFPSPMWCYGVVMYPPHPYLFLFTYLVLAVTNCFFGLYLLKKVR